MPSLSPLFRFYLPSLWLLLLTLGACDDAPKGSFGELETGDRCEGGGDCKSGLCVGMGGQQGVCTVSCDQAGSDACVNADNWACGTAHEVDVQVCLCQPDSNREICGDKLDNDCDGHVDDCLKCDGKSVAPDDERHCGMCDRRCVDDATCTDGVCVCADGIVKDSCVRDPSAPECQQDKDCDDDIGCTADLCVDGACRHKVVPARCDANEVCDLRKGGCSVGRPCAVDLDCEDNDPCTTEEHCDAPTRVCLWAPLDGDEDGAPPRVCGGEDCNDDAPETFPGAPELCDGEDNSCDGKIDAPLSKLSCDEGQECKQGKCICTDAGLTQCGNDCSDLKTDEAHCGTCDKHCTATQICESGKCKDANECAMQTDNCFAPFVCVDKVGGFNCECPAGYEGPIGGPCDNVDECAADNLNDCAPGACKDTVGSYTCECPAGYTGDGYACQDVNECLTVTCSGHGDCINFGGSYSCACDPGYSADGSGNCVVTNACQAGTLAGHAWCNGICIDILETELHCGACNHSCGTGTCNNGACDCTAAGSGLSYCENARTCVNNETNAAHCGGCDAPACPSGGGYCVGGDCFCPGGTKQCGSTCTQLGTIANCADCGNACPQGASCNASKQCVCPAGQTVCNGVCTDLQNDELHCGSCTAAACAVGATCITGGCQCPANTGVCNGSCLDMRNDPLHCKTCNQVCSVACGATACATVTDLDVRTRMSCAVLSDGRVRCWGYNANGPLGVGSSSVNRPTEVFVLTTAAKVFVGGTHACALTTAGDVYCWGDNASRQVLSTSTTDQSSPVLSGSGFTLLALGANFTCGQKNDTDKSIVCWGSDGSGQHGDGTTANSTTVTGPPTTGAGSLANVSKLVAGSAHVCGLKSGTVYCWGDNYSSQVSGVDYYVYSPLAVAGVTSVTDIAAGNLHTCAISGGKVYCWGYGYYGQLGNGSNSSFSTPTEVAGITTAVSVSAGNGHTCATLQSKAVVCWGANTDGQLGDGTYTSTLAATANLTNGASLTDLSLGDAHSCARNASGEVLCWGAGYSSGASTTFTTDANVPTEISW